jgi:NAD(P)-dependent dehydrogenase (short-subunit alcohol dehydrogenase family)
MGRVEGKVVIVTGGASNPGLGRTTALTLGREGAKVVVTDLDIDGANLCAEEICESGGQAIAIRQDVTEEEGWKKVISATIQQFGRLDVLINNAGIAVLMPISEMSLDDWNRQINVNLTSVFLGCKYAMPEMAKHGGGSLINLSSVAGLVGLPSCVAYGAAKGGVRIMSKSLALEGASDNIRCNSVHPGVIWTNMQAGARGAGEENQDNTFPDEMVPPGVPLGRVGKPEDIANCILYLASDEANYVTGAEFTVDAGMTAH